LRLRIPCAPLTKTPSISAVADGPVISAAYFALINPCRSRVTEADRDILKAAFVVLSLV